MKKRQFYILFLFLLSFSAVKAQRSKTSLPPSVVIHVKDKENKIIWAFDKEKYKYGLLDDKRNALTPFIFDGHAKFDQGAALVRLGNSQVLLLNNGKFFDLGTDPIFRGADGTYMTSGDTCYNNKGEIVGWPFEISLFQQLNGGYYTPIPPTADCDKVKWITKTGTQIATKGKKWGLVNSKFTAITPFQYDQFLGIGKEKYLFPGQYDQNNVMKWGLIDTLGNKVLECAYQYILPHNDGWILAVDHLGKCTYFHESSTISKSRYLDYFGLVELELEPHRLFNHFRYMNFSFYSMNIENTNWKLMRHGEDGKMGLYTTNDSIILPVEYDDIDITHLQSNGFFFAQKGGKFNIFDQKLRQIQPHKYDQIVIPLSSQGKYIAVQNEKKWGYLTSNGDSVIIPMEYEKLHFDSNYNWIQAKKNGRWGIINEKNECILPFEYDEIFDRMLVKNAARGGVDSVGNVIISCAYDYIWYASSSNLYILFNGGKAKIYDPQRRKTIPFYFETSKLDYVWYDKGSGYYMVCLNGKWGCINDEGEIVIPIEYKALSGFTNGKAHAVHGAIRPLSVRHYYYSDPNHRKTYQPEFSSIPADYMIDLSGRLTCIRGEY